MDKLKFTLYLYVCTYALVCFFVGSVYLTMKVAESFGTFGASVVAMLAGASTLTACVYICHISDKINKR